MDIKLAGEIDGITAMEQISKVKDIPVIYLSGNSDDATMRRIKKHPFAGVHCETCRFWDFDGNDKSVFF
jgi:CheY-like chemotaxis protein